MQAFNGEVVDSSKRAAAAAPHLDKPGGGEERLLQESRLCGRHLQRQTVHTSLCELICITSALIESQE